MKRVLCFPTLTNEKAKKVLDWLISGKFTLGFYMYDICRVGTFAGSIDKMDVSTYSIVVHSGERIVFGDLSVVMIEFGRDKIVFLTYDEWEELFDGMNPREVLE